MFTSEVSEKLRYNQKNDETEFFVKYLWSSVSLKRMQIIKKFLGAKDVRIYSDYELSFVFEGKK